MVNLISISVARSADVEGSPAEINNNKNTSFTAVSFFRFIRHKLNQVVAVPVCRYFNETVDSLHRHIVLSIGRAVFGEEAMVMMPQSTLTFIITTLLAFTEIKSQGNAGFPFRTHPKAIMVSVTSVVVYGFASAAEYVISGAGFDHNSVYAIIIRLGRVVSLCILVASLASLFYL